MKLYVSCFVFCSLFYTTACLSQKKNISNSYGYSIRQNTMNDYKYKTISSKTSDIPLFPSYHLSKHNVKPYLQNLQLNLNNPLLFTRHDPSNWKSQIRPQAISWSVNKFQVSPYSISNTQNVIQHSYRNAQRSQNLDNYLKNSFVINNLYHNLRKRHADDKINEENTDENLLKETETSTIKNVPKSYEVYESITDDIQNPVYNQLYGYVPINKKAITSGHGYTIFGKQYAFYVTPKSDEEKSSVANDTLASQEEKEEIANENDIQRT